MDVSQLGRRWDRAQTNKVLVRNLHNGHPSHIFARVSGTRGDAYNVQITDAKVVCTCVDFSMRHSHNSPLCKHIIAVLLVHFAIEFEQLQAFAEAVHGRRNSAARAVLRGLGPAEMVSVETRTRSRCKVPELKLVDPRKSNGEMCPVCLCSLAPEDTTYCGKTCGAMMHKSCIQAWLKVGQGCPLCKSAWVDGARMCRVVKSKQSAIADALV